jgi:hypothetical protein
VYQALTSVTEKLIVKIVLMKLDAVSSLNSLVVSCVESK